jgi:hypothetical protein
MSDVTRTEATFEFMVPTERARAFPLLGAWGEKAWAGPDWQPQFVYPTPPRDEPHEVFTVLHGPGEEAVWVNTVFDEATGRVQYVYVLPTVQAVVIDLALFDETGPSTRVRVTYRRTALHRSMNDRVRALGAGDRLAGPEWAALIAKALTETRG